MEATSTVSAAPPGLAFEKSASRAVAVEGGFMRTMEQYAPRISSVFRMASSAGVVVSGASGAMSAHTAMATANITQAALAGAAATTALTASGFAAAAGLLMLVAGAVMIAYGDKEKQKKRAALNGDAQEVIPKDPISRLFHEVGKIASPSNYPIEAASGYALLACFALTTAGILTGDVFNIAIGVSAAVASAIALFGHEKSKAKPAQDGLNFVESKSEAVAVEGQKKTGLVDNPVRLSALILVAANTAGVVKGILQGDMLWTIAGALGIASQAVMAIFVRKNDFNVNAAKEATATAPSPRVSQAEPTERLQQDAQLGYA